MAEGFAIRHRVLLLISWAQLPVLAATGLYLGDDLVVFGVICVITAAMSLAGMLLSGRVVSSCAVSVSVAFAACALIYYSGDLGLMPLYLPLVIVAVAYYRLRAPLLAGLSVIVTYHFVVSTWLLETQTLVEASLHSGFMTALSLALMLGWRIGIEDEPVALTTDRYWTSFHAAPIGMAVLKPSGEFVEVNIALGELLGYDLTHFPGRNIRAFVHGDDMPILGEAWEAIGNARSQTFSAWLRCLTAEGEAIWGRVSLALVPRTEEQSAMVILQIEDATTSRHETDRLERLLHGKDEFVATVGNEMKEPLGTLIDLTSGDPVLRHIHTRAREVASVVDDLVASALAETAPPEVVPSDIDIAAIVRCALDGLADDEGIPVDIRASHVWADPDLTRQIVNGMLGNAIRFGGPRMRVQVFNSGPDTVVQVIDDGPGIPPTQQERIFSGDLRGGQPVTRPAAFGLTLSVGRYLARRMEGDITYRRSGDGLNIFELRLPSEELTKTYKPRPRPRIGSDLSV